MTEHHDTDHEHRVRLRHLTVGAVAVAAAIALAGCGVGGTDQAATPAASSSTSASATPSASASSPSSAPASASASALATPPASAAPVVEVDGGDSVCGLAGVVLTGGVPSAPDAVWVTGAGTSYPTSTTYGPKATDPDGQRSCFQHSPTGALFMAANLFAQATRTGTYFTFRGSSMAQGAYRDDLVKNMATDPPTAQVRVTGFKVLAYDGATARIDVAVNTTLDDGDADISGIFDLVWQSGDWKISADIPEPAYLARLDSLTGYTPWTAATL